MSQPESAEVGQQVSHVESEPPDDSLVEFGESPADYRRAHRGPRTGMSTAMLGAGAVIGLAGVGRALVVGFTPLTWTLLGVALPLAAVPVVRLARTPDVR